MQAGGRQPLKIKKGKGNMSKTFNVNGVCYPDEHYMVNLESRLVMIKELVDNGKYFMINRARQYGKSTILRGIREYLSQEYVMILLDFQSITTEKFKNETVFSIALAKTILKAVNRGNVPLNGLEVSCVNEIEAGVQKGELDLSQLFDYLSMMCDTSEKPIVLMIDEVDYASNNQVFLDFLAQLRAAYLARKDFPTFQSVILAGVYDIKNLKLKLRTEEEYVYNSPWNIAADFNVDMSFSSEDIAGMLTEYEADYHTGMDMIQMSEMIYEYTNGYPYMVSRICQLLDEMQKNQKKDTDTTMWCAEGVSEAVKKFLCSADTLFDDMTKKLADYPELKKMLKEILFYGKRYSYESENSYINLGFMFGFLKNEANSVMIANRIYETKLYNIFMSEEETSSLSYHAALRDKNQFIEQGYLNMNLVLEKFIEHFEEVYGNFEESFLEENGRRFFLLYLRPIINGVGHYYIEARTRDMKRTDIIVDYHGEQYIIELKIWRGEEYNKRGEKQLFDYLQYYHVDKGYLLSFNFNKKKQTGMKTIRLGGKEIIEAVV